MAMLTLAHVLNFLLMFALPIALGVFLRRRFALPWRLFFTGMATFILSQVVHIPLNIILGRLGVFAAAPERWLVLTNAILLGLSAGICEEGARYLVLRFWRKDARSWRTALMFGAGHGGVEALLVGAVTALAFVQITALRTQDLSSLGLTPEQLTALQTQMATYTSLPWPAALLGALERLFALCLHLSLTVMVMQVFLRRNWLWLVAAILWHTAANAVAVYLIQALGGAGSLPAAYWTEAALGVFALASLGIIFALRQPEPPAPEPAEPGAPLPTPEAGPLTPPPLTAESLKDTRYQ
jgi:uncharacterized membrane protein YhfC